MGRCLFILVLCVAALSAAPAAAQTVKRCVDAQGNTVFTDRPCDAVDARPQEARDGLPPGMIGADGAVGGFAIRGCARTPDALLYGVRTALEAHDVNRLANFYHWPGTGAGAARFLMDQLEAIAGRPVVAVDLTYPLPGPDATDLDAELRRELLALAPAGSDGTATAETNQAAAPAWTRAPVVPGGSPDAPAPAETGAAPEPGGRIGAPATADADAGPPPPMPTGLHVEQAEGPADPGSRSLDFGLVRHAGCWWITL